MCHADEAGLAVTKNGAARMHMACRTGRHSHGVPARRPVPVFVCRLQEANLVVRCCADRKVVAADPYAPLVRNIEELFCLATNLTKTPQKADLTGWVGRNPVQSYEPLTRNIDTLHKLL